MTDGDGPKAIVFSVDLEPNKNGTLEGIRDAMEWFDRTVPRGTIFTTCRIATEMPSLVAELSKSFEIGVYVHPCEFGHEHDQLAELPAERQRELIIKTQEAVAKAVLNSDRIYRFHRFRRVKPRKSNLPWKSISSTSLSSVVT